MSLFKKRERFDPRYGMDGYICDTPSKESTSMHGLNDDVDFDFSSLLSTARGDESKIKSFEFEPLESEVEVSSGETSDSPISEDGLLADDEMSSEEDSVVGHEVSTDKRSEFRDEVSSADEDFASSNEVPANDDSVREISVEGEHVEENSARAEFYEDFARSIKEVKDMEKTNGKDLTYERRITVRYHFSYLNGVGVRISSSKETESAAYQASQDKNVVRKYHWADTGEELTSEEVDRYLP